MHEMAIAGAVLEGVLEHAGGRRVTHVQLKVGHLRQVVPSALRFSWELITRETTAEGAALGIEQVEATGRCRSCGLASPQRRFPFRCGGCGELDIEVVGGDELLIDWLEVEQNGTGQGTDEARPGEPARGEGQQSR